MVTIKEVRNYITKRYERWLDYSTFHCERQGMYGEGGDLLNEVMINLLEKPDDQLIELYNSKSKQYRELDFFVLRMIKINATSDTAPYRHKKKTVPTDDNVNYFYLEIEDAAYEEDDIPGEIMRKTNIIREALEDIEPYTDPLDIKAFYFRYFDGEQGTDWKEDDHKKCYDRCYKTIKKVRSYADNIQTRRLKVKSIWYNFAG